MFSSVFDKVVSANAPDILATFPPRGDLPASSSTLCCLSFADRFISHYPTARARPIDDDIKGRLLLGRAEPPAGIAISADDLEATMESAADLGGRLAAALAGTVRSKRREPAAAPVPDLLTKVRGIFGNRLTCVGREIRVSRNLQAEKDETLLLRQVHALKNAALEACNGEKWCIVVSSGGESLTVCSIPLPAVEEGGPCGCDFLVFDPCPRPEMKLRGSYIVKFTTVRGLQLHLLSALGEIWGGSNLPRKDGMKRELVALSVVMKAIGKGEEVVDADARRRLEDSVTRLRKAEKAAAIKIKREEVEALRRALEKSGQQNQPVLIAPMSGGMFGLTDGSSELQRVDKGGDLLNGEPPVQSNTQSYRRLEVPGAIVDRNANHQETVALNDADVNPMPQKNEAQAEHPAHQTQHQLLDPPVPRDGLGAKQPQGEDRTIFTSRDSLGDRAQLRPPAADISPPLSLRRSETGERRRRRPENRDDSLPPEGGICPAQGGSAGTGRTEEAVAASVTAGTGGAPCARGGQNGVRVDRVEQGSRHMGVDDDGVCPLTRPDEGVTFGDNPLHRALLRSIEGEELAEYSQRAYSVYRTHGMIQGEAELGDYRAPEPTAYNLRLSANQLHCSATHPPASSPMTVSPGTSSNNKTPANGLVSEHNAERKECVPVGVGVREAVVPFSPPSVSPQQLTTRQLEQGHRSNGHGESFAEAVEAVEATAVPSPTEDQELRVVDVSEAEGDIVASHLPDKPTSPAGAGFRSRLRTPRAGRALALASANARGNCGRCRGETSLGFRRDVSACELRPPPPPATITAATAAPARPREAWTKEGRGVGHQLDGAEDGRKSKPASLRASDGASVVGSDDDEDGVAARSGAPPKEAIRPGEGRGGKRRPARQQARAKQDAGGKYRTATKLGGQVGGGCDRNIHRYEGSPRLETDMQLNSQHSSGSKLASEAELSKERPMEWPAADDESPPVNTPAPGNSTPSMAKTIPTAKNRGRRGIDAPLNVPRFQVSGRQASAATAQSKSPSVDGGAVGLHRSRSTGKAGDERLATSGGLGDAGKAPSNESFVWFGQPETPPGRGSPGGVGTPRGAGGEEEDASSPTRRQISRALFCLQMQVRRQRALIDQAFQAREEERRLRRARAGMEAFMRIKDLRARRSARPPAASRVSSNNNSRCPARQQPPLAEEGPSASGGVQAKEGPRTPAPSPPRPKTTVEARGLQTATTESSASEADRPDLPTPAAAPLEGGGRGVVGGEGTATIARGQPPAVDHPVQEEPREENEVAPRVPAAADNPWRQVVSARWPQPDGGAPRARREPTPPPVRFDVEASAFRDRAAGAGGGGVVSQEQEKARRQERYEALRARKMAEAEERRRGQKERRQAAAREEQRRQQTEAAATAAAAATAIDEDQYGEGSELNPGRQGSPHHGYETIADSPSARHNRYAPGISVVRSDSSTARPGSSSLAKNDDGLARQGVGAPGHGNGGSSGGVARPSPPSAGRAALPAVRGFSRRSNRKLVRNAINFLCLAGGHLEEKKARVLEALDSHPASNFVVLLAHTKLLSFKGLYACNGEEDGTAYRVFGLGPPHVDASMASGFFKYNSAAREFREVHSKTLGKTTDAVSMEPTRLRRPKGSDT